MGMYTELVLGVNLRSDTPENIINILNYMLSGISDSTKPEITDHPLFSTERWPIMLVCDSYYFDGRTDSSMERDTVSKRYELNVRTNFKNYNNEVDLFLDFIRPYLYTDGFLGYMRYEDDDDPTLIYNDVYGGGIKYKEYEEVG